MIATDEQILELVSNEDTLNKGFKMLMDVYQQRLYHHIRSLLNNHDDTDDVLQNTLIKVFRNIKRFEGRSNLYTWLYRIATNEAKTFLKKNMRKNSFIESENMGDFTDSLVASEDTNGEFIKSVLQKAILELPPKQKAIFSLRYFEEMSYNDMSEVLGTSVGALKASYHHAVKKVESFLKQTVLY